MPEPDEHFFAELKRRGVFRVAAMYAVTCLEANVDLPGMYANLYLAQNPAFDSLRGEPRFKRVLERAGL